MACELVTGHTGTPHVTAAQAAALNAGILGRDTCILETGNKLAATMVTANSIRIDTGDAMIQGRQVSFPTSTELVLESGAQGLKRIDYVAVRYTKEPEAELENAELVILKGEASNSPQPPVVATADIDSGASVAEFPLYSITIDGIAPKTPQRLVKINDYILAQGTSNGWVWRKWVSGRLEQSIVKTITGVDFDIPWNSVMETGQITAGSYPVAFIERPISVVTAGVIGLECGIIVEESSDDHSLGHSPAIHLWRPTDGTSYGNSVRYRAIAVGRWQ